MLQRRTSQQNWIRAARKVQMCTLFPRRPYPWIQLAGHSTGFEQGTSPAWILKRSSSNEKVISRILFPSVGLTAIFLVDTGGVFKAGE
jgi:hypothetical protein